MPERVNRHGVLGPYGVRYGAIWNIGVVVFVIIAIAVRPGGVRGPRAAAADERAPRAT
jgi:hypothetical protein